MESSRWVIIFVLISLASILIFPQTSYANAAWLKYFRKDTLLNTYMRTYAVHADQLWVGTYGDGIMVYSGGETTIHNNKNTRLDPGRDEGLISNNVTSIAIDGKNGRVWIGTNEGVASCNLEGREWKRFTSRDGLPNDVIRDVAVDTQGTLWVGTPSGVARYDGANWQVFDERSGLPQNSVHSLKIDGDSVWVGTVGGCVSRFHGGRWVTVMQY
jgi:ligand-binding sensor domain-containing protein